MIRIDDLAFRYREGDFCLRVPEMRIAARERVAIIGPSGSGKTTLLRLIAGIALPEQGSVVTHEVDVGKLGDAARRDFRIRNIGLVFQEFELIEYLHVLDNVLLPFRINRALQLNEAARERALELIRRVGLGDKATRPVGQLSQGERQRVAVCRSLVTRPVLLLADEPTGNLDPNNKGRVLDILIEFVDEEDATLVTVTHDHDLLDRFDRVVDLKELLEPA